MRIIIKLTSVFLFALTVACKKPSITDNPVPTPPLNNNEFIKGVDISWLTEMEAAGRKFYNSAGSEQDCMQILKGLGMNTIRLRVWVNPSNGWNNTADVVAKAIRAKNVGMKILIDFH